MLSPYSSQITLIYQATQSDWYNSVTSLTNQLKTLSNIPIIGGVGDVSGSISTILTQVKSTIGILYMLLFITVPAIGIGILMLVGGFFISSRSENKSVAISSESHTKKGRHCPHCGEEVSKGDKFCPDCGRKV